MAKMLYRKDTGEILGVHIIGLHAADLIHEASNAIATKQTVQVRTYGDSMHVSLGSLHLEDRLIACWWVQQHAQGRHPDQKSEGNP